MSERTLALGLDRTAIDGALERLRTLRASIEQRLAEARARRDAAAESASGAPGARPAAPAAEDAMGRAFRGLFHNPRARPSVPRVPRARFAIPPADAPRPTGAALRARREALGLSQRQLALWVRGSRSALAELERVDHDSAGLRLALAAALDRLEARAAQEGEAT